MVQQMEFKLVRRQRFFHQAVQQVELRHGVVGYAGGFNFAGTQQLVKSRRRVVGAREPVGPVHEKKFDAIGAQQAQGFFQALDEVRASGVVMRDLPFMPLRVRKTNPGLGDNFQFVAQARRERQRLAQHGFDSVCAIDFRRVNGRDAKFKAGMQPTVDFLRSGFGFQQPPSAVNQP